MFQGYATEAGSKIWVVDLKPEGLPNQPRWRPGDPPLPPQRVLMDYETGVGCCQRNPLQYRAALMDDDEYDALLKDLGFSEEARANNPMRCRADLVSAEAFDAMLEAHKAGKAAAPRVNQ